MDSLVSALKESAKTKRLVFIDFRRVRNGIIHFSETLHYLVNAFFRSYNLDYQIPYGEICKLNGICSDFCRDFSPGRGLLL